MGGFHAGVIPWICFLWITEDYPCGRFLRCFWYILTSPVTMENQWFFNFSNMFCFFNILHYVRSFQHLTKHPGNDFSWIQIYDTGKVHKSFKCPNIVDIRTPSGIRMRRIKVLVEDIFEFLAEVRIYSCLDIRLDFLKLHGEQTCPKEPVSSIYYIPNVKRLIFSVFRWQKPGVSQSGSWFHPVFQCGFTDSKILCHIAKW